MNMNRRELLLSAAAGVALARTAVSAASVESGTEQAASSGATRSSGSHAATHGDVQGSQLHAATRGDGDQVFELRQYTLHRGQRDTLISLFEQHFIEPQNELGAHIVGLFRDLDDPDRFVWLRSFRNMRARQKALAAFYEGPGWQSHRTEANATMVDSDNVLMLRPAEAGASFRAEIPATGAGGIIGATIYYLHDVDSAQFTHFFDEAILPRLSAAGVHPIARLVTEESANNYPRLPIRERDRAFVWFARWPDAAAEEASVARFRAVSGWRDSAPEAVLPALMQKPERLRLTPTARSPLR